MSLILHQQHRFSIFLKQHHSTPFYSPPPAETRSDSLLVFFICLAFPPATEMSHVDKKFKQFEDPIITMVVVANSVALHLQIQSKKTQSLKPNSLNTCHQLTATTL